MAAYFCPWQWLIWSLTCCCNHDNINGNEQNWPSALVFVDVWSAVIVFCFFKTRWHFLLSPKVLYTILGFVTTVVEHFFSPFYGKSLRLCKLRTQEECWSVQTVGVFFPLVFSFSPSLYCDSGHSLPRMLTHTQPYMYWFQVKDPQEYLCTPSPLLWVCEFLSAGYLLRTAFLQSLLQWRDTLAIRP